jgi:F0F1-type ATP synthase membrane subunit c/vacuolar-type H+-ATPase subunit K
MLLTTGTPGGSFPTVAAGFAAVTAGLAVAVAGFCAVAGLAGACALAAKVLAANKKIKAACFMTLFNSGSFLWEVYQALPHRCT